MKKFLKEFKDFAMKGNVLELAVAVILGGAFGKVVNAVVEIFLNPILENMKMEGGGTGIAGSLVTFAFVVIEFILTALVLFLIIKSFNKAKSLKKKEEAAPAAPTTKECPYCLSQIPIKATRCPHCTSEVK